MTDALRTLGPYQILELRGQGGMGAVYRARHPELKRIVALKVLRPAFAIDGAVLSRFRREAVVGAAIKHPALVEVYDFGRDGEMDYIVMEWVDGVTVADLLVDGPMPLERTLELGLAALAGLSACHAAGILHRDLKPANLMIDASGALRILDFGLVTQEGRTALTQEGELLGTPRYLPPELFALEVSDARSDLYQIGTVLYECLLGYPLFQKQGFGELMQSIRTPQLPALPEPGPNGVVQAALERLTACDRAARFPDAASAAAALRRALTAVRRGSGPAPEKPARAAAPPPPAAAEGARRLRMALAVVAVLAVITASGLALILQPALRVAVPPPTVASSAPLPSANPPRADSPLRDARPFHVLDFSRGATNRPGIVGMGAPSLFMDDEEVALQLGARDARDDSLCGPVPVPNGITKVYLSFRITGGRRDERIVAQMTPGGQPAPTGELAVLRGTGDGSSREGLLPVDMRLFKIPGHMLRLQMVYDGPSGKEQGIRLDRFELYGERDATLKNN